MPSVNKWEYLICHYSINVNLTSISEILNSYGDRYWELINIIDDTTIDNQDDCAKIFTFKRKRIINTFYDYDKRGVRAFVCYSEATGTWRIECYRKKTNKEIEENPNMSWKMKREENINTFKSRLEAYNAVLQLAEEICKEFKL